jgi:hypothetical protein
MSTSLVDECYRRAREARRSAEITSTPTQKTHFLELEQRWLRAAESVAPNIVRETKAPAAQPKITDVEQPLQDAQEEDAAAPRDPDEIGDEQAASANLALTMQCRGLDQAIPLRLSSEDIGKLALEAQVRKISLGELVGMLIEGAMAEGLSRVLDGEPSREAARAQCDGLRKGQAFLNADAPGGPSRRGSASDGTAASVTSTDPHPRKSF